MNPRLRRLRPTGPKTPCGRLFEERKQCRGHLLVPKKDDAPDFSPLPPIWSSVDLGLPAQRDLSLYPSRKRKIELQATSEEPSKLKKEKLEFWLEEKTATYKDSRDFEERSKPVEPELAAEIDVTYKKSSAKKAKSRKNRYFYKCYGDTKVTFREVLSQELFRLINPQQHKTRLIVDSKDEVIVLSEEIENYRGLDDFSRLQKKNISSGTYPYLGNILLTCLWLGENDLHPGNIGIDKAGSFVKIDGNDSFISLHSSADKNFQITEPVIASLPYLHPSYDTRWWLDTIEDKEEHKEEKKRETHPDSNILTPAMSSDPAIRNGINATILKIITLPDKFLKEFVNEYVDGPENRILYNETIKRKAALQAAAFQNKSFQDYVKTPGAKKELIMYFRYLNDFTTVNKHKPFTFAYEEEMIVRFKKIENDINIVTTSPAPSTVHPYSSRCR